VARQGVARQGGAWHGRARIYIQSGSVWLCVVMLGWAWFGSAMQGKGVFMFSKNMTFFINKKYLNSISVTMSK